MANNNNNGMPQISPQLMQEFAQYFDPSAFSAPNGFGNQSGGNGGLSLSSFEPNPISNPNPAFGVTSSLFGNGVASTLDPISGFISGLFGGGGPKWKPYVDSNGNYVWTNPNKANPVPVSSVPGSNLAPNQAYRQSADNLSAMEALFPGLSQLTAGQMIPQQQAALAAAQATSGPYAQLMTQLYSQFAPQLAQLGNQVNEQTMMGTAQNQADVLNGPGQALTTAANNLLKQTNPEYYQQRAGTNDQINNLYSSIDSMMNGGLSTTENREIAQGAAQQGNQRGTANAPSNLDTIGNAMRYGSAGTQRTQQEQSALSTAIQSANNFLPQSQVSFNPIAQATGMNMNNPGSSQFTGINNGAQNAYGTLASMSSGLGNNVNALQQQNNQINQQNNQMNSWQNVFGTITSGLGNLMKGATGVLGAL